jgi:hypothetical protein
MPLIYVASVLCNLTLRVVSWQRAVLTWQLDVLEALALLLIVCTLKRLKASPARRLQRHLAAALIVSRYAVSPSIPPLRTP